MLLLGASEIFLNMSGRNKESIRTWTVLVSHIVCIYTLSKQLNFKLENATSVCKFTHVQLNVYTSYMCNTKMATTIDKVQTMNSDY